MSLLLQRIGQAAFGPFDCFWALSFDLIRGCVLTSCVLLPS